MLSQQGQDANAFAPCPCCEFKFNPSEFIPLSPALLAGTPANAKANSKANGKAKGKAKGKANEDGPSLDSLIGSHNAPLLAHFANLEYFHFSFCFGLPALHGSKFGHVLAKVLALVKDPENRVLVFSTEPEALQEFERLLGVSSDGSICCFKATSS